MEWCSFDHMYKIIIICVQQLIHLFFNVDNPSILHICTLYICIYIVDICIFFNSRYIICESFPHFPWPSFSFQWTLAFSTLHWMSLNLISSLFIRYLLGINVLLNIFVGKRFSLTNLIFLILLLNYMISNWFRTFCPCFFSFSTFIHNVQRQPLYKWFTKLYMWNTVSRNLPNTFVQTTRQITC